MENPKNQFSIFPARGSYLLRKGRRSLPGNYYFLRASTAKQRPLFLDGRYCRLVFDAIKWLGDHHRWYCLCAMIMPDHLHLVSRLSRGWSLDQVMKVLKGYTARQINQMERSIGPVWQDGYYDHCIRDERALREIILYCYYNPVRKGLVKRPEDYPYWWCRYRI